MTLQYVVVLYMASIGTSGLSLVIGAYLYLVAASKCIQGSLNAIGQCTNEKINKNILQKFIEFVQFHAQIKQLSYKMIGAKFG